jgi:hypothetical protein
VISFRRVGAVGVAVASLTAAGGSWLASHQQAQSAYVPANAVEHDLTVVKQAVVAPQYDGDSCALPVDARADLRFVVENLRPAHVERLLAISTGAASMVVLSDQQGLTIRPAVASSTGRSVGGGPRRDERPVLLAALQGLRAGIRPGQSIPVTFHFERGGDLHVSAPVLPCTESR